MEAKKVKDSSVAIAQVMVPQDVTLQEMFTAVSS